MADVSIDMETGDLSQFDAVTGVSISAHVDAAQASTSYGLHVDTDGNNANRFGQNHSDISASTSYRIRFYLKLDDFVMDNNDSIIIFWVRAPGATNSCRMYLTYTTGGGHTLKFWAYRDNGNSSKSSEYSIPATGEILVEYRTTKADTTSSNDGTAEMWIDGVSKEELTGLDNNGSGGHDQSWYGFVGNQNINSGSMYMDEIIIRDDATEIGPVPAPPSDAGKGGFWATQKDFTFGSNP